MSGPIFGGGGYSPPFPFSMMPEPTVRDRQREHFRRLEDEHWERVRRQERIGRIWSGLGIVLFFVAVGLFLWGLWEMLGP